MRVIGVRSGVYQVLVLVMLMGQLSPTLATAQSNWRQAAIQDNTQTAGLRGYGPVEVTFTKWRTAVLPPTGVPTRFFFKGFVGGDVGAGDFVGELLDRKLSTACTAFDPPCTPGVTPPTITTPITALHAIYEVQAGERSFTALIQGGSNGVTGAAILQGVVIAGWRTGASVSVTFQTLTNCDNAPAGACFRGVIRIEPGL
jgi:hypothetical protein